MTGRAQGRTPRPSDSRAGRELATAASGIDRPADVARALMDQGLSLSDAHGSLERLAMGERVIVAIDRGHITSFRNPLRDLGVLLMDEQPAAQISSEFVESL